MMMPDSPRVVADGPAARDEAAEVISGGGLVAIPTDTVYGLAVDPRDPVALARLATAKRRPPEKGIALLLADPDQAALVGLLTPTAAALGHVLWPGGLTLVVPLRADAGLAPAVVGPDGTIGLRVPDHDCPRRIAARAGPLAASSANVSGESEASDAAEISRLFGSLVDLVVDGGPARGGVASTVVDCTAGEPRLLRVGAIDEATIRAVLAASGVGR
jgi:L-threonylcarbamoyladenylate synthase